MNQGQPLKSQEACGRVFTRSNDVLGSAPPAACRAVQACSTPPLFASTRSLTGYGRLLCLAV